ncbi:MAG TPA: hypothetical protein VGJ39_05145 [Vicinamibacterales bacterium]|jgi:hypothetical protein
MRRPTNDLAMIGRDGVSTVTNVAQAADRQKVAPWSQHDDDASWGSFCFVNTSTSPLPIDEPIAASVLVNGRTIRPPGAIASSHASSE